jgi:hypothetical protein
MAITRSKEDKISFEYDLYLNSDTQTDGHMHWFYFQASCINLAKGTKIRFNIRNLFRNKSLYQEGMLPRICLVNLDDPKSKGNWLVDPRVTSEVKFF